MAESGVRSIAYAFPNIQIVTTAIDPEINDKFYVLPGIGNFGDRYFGTEPNDECWEFLFKLCFCVLVSQYFMVLIWLFWLVFLLAR